MCLANFRLSLWDVARLGAQQEVGELRNAATLRWKLASYEAAGNLSVMFIRPFRTDSVGTTFPAWCAGLISELSLPGQESFRLLFKYDELYQC